ncbi:beta-ketoacyl-[acyl-carrier-protein] synthase FabY [Marinobacterium nitratireducens]|uniref:Beta-ketoacyl-[acyl-carrier-protein] synthase FabY n=1 Tax=Marinobacterium nitratireducens TaxID=518897 RepID=A0A917Z9H8_9GAMM|nr:beta-ketoacyl synthase [Marinobacterium nitratireducens]GGO78788.1 beta-ketoacyl-[acyl-carrier-protein] synthase FabY [Marinobacterium nitratireducens]
MSQLPVIVGFGGINPAGRASSHHAYRRLIIDRLDADSRRKTLLSLATLMKLASFEDGNYLTAAGERLPLEGLLEQVARQVLDNTLVRRIHPNWFDVHAVMFNRPAEVEGPDGTLRFTLRRRQMPHQIPDNWEIRELSANQLEISVAGPCDVIFPDIKDALVQSAGMLPTGFAPGELYQSRNHPRNLQMTVYAASDALYSSGIPFETVLERVRPDQVGVYASNSIGQLDDFGFGGLTKFPALGKRTTSKQMPLGYAQMPADFVNAYILGNVGVTGGSLGACATFLYNLRNAVNDIRSGLRKVVLVGGSDAPVTPEVIEGFRSMGALAEDKDLRALDGLAELGDDDYRRACRPFGENCGFTIGESSQFVMLMSDDLALELGAQIFGAVPDVFVNADGHKKSISAPGIGNYLCLGKAAGLVRSMLGDNALRHRSFVQAHGTSTPQNRVTESHVINEIARAFDIPSWPVAAIKAQLGHSQGTAAGDQLTISLGTWQYGYIPGILNTREVAGDVHQSNLRFALDHIEVGSDQIDAVLLNSKGFGGNNASAPLLSPQITEQLLTRRHGAEAMKAWRTRQAGVIERAAAYDDDNSNGLTRPIYRYDYSVLEGSDLQISADEIRLPGYPQAVKLSDDNPYKDMC